jgi:hypothetical protein
MLLAGAQQTVFCHTCKAEMFIAHSALYTVSHFIDCDAIAHRLCARLLRHATQHMKWKEYQDECNQI